MSRYSREWESGAPAASSRLPDSPPPVRVSRARKPRGASGRGGVPREAAARPQPRPREVLCEAGPGRVERAGRGTARWGRYLLPADSVEALRSVGSFGAVEVADLAAVFESASRARRALRDLRRQRLLRVERFRRGCRVFNVASLTKAGRRLMERSVDPREPGDEEAQRYRAGPARSAQVLHDTAVYRAARREMAAIEARGGRVVLVRTDDDLRRLAWRRAQRARRAGASAEEARAAAAASLRLTVRDGNLTYPDIRIEYERTPATGVAAAAAFVDVEVSTPDYRGPALRAKAAAGFRIYRMGPDGALRADSPAPAPELSR